MLIPETLIVNKQILKHWYFTSTKEKESKILKKNSENLNVINVCKHFSGFKVKEDRFDVLFYIKEQIMVNNLDNKINKMFIRYVNDKYEEIKITDFITLLTDNK